MASFTTGIGSQDQRPRIVYHPYPLHSSNSPRYYWYWRDCLIDSPIFPRVDLCSICFYRCIDRLSPFLHRFPLPENRAGARQQINSNILSDLTEVVFLFVFLLSVTLHQANYGIVMGPNISYILYVRVMCDSGPFAYTPSPFRHTQRTTTPL